MLAARKTLLTRPSGSVITPVTFDAVGAAPADGFRYAIGAATATAVASRTWSHTVAADANCLVLGLTCWDNSTGVAAIANHSRSVTYNGVAMTSLGATPGSNANDGFIEWFRLFSPATGANNVVVDVTRLSTPAAQTWAILCASLSFKNVATVTAGTAQAAASGTPSVSVNSDNNSFTAGMLSSGVNDPTGYNQTSRASILTSSYSFGFQSHTVIGTAPGASPSVTHSESATGNILLAQAINLAPA